MNDESLSKMNDRDDAFDLPIVRDFDKVCFEFGDRDAILLHGSSPVSYFEIQEYSKALSYQLYHRFGWPDYVLVDCQGSAVGEAVATLACMRIRRPFVPVSAMDQHRPNRMKTLVNLLTTQGKQYSFREHEKSKQVDESRICKSSPSIVAVVVCENDHDPLLSVFRQAGIHRILYLDSTGCLHYSFSVPTTFRFRDTELPPYQDDIYVMFTSGTTTAKPKAVVGSHRATHARLRWFLDTFSSSPRVGRRTKLTFVDGITELWSGLLDPMNVLVCVSQTQLRARGVIALFEDMKCTQLLLLPSQANQLLLASLKSNPSLNMDRIILSGEVCYPHLWEKLQNRYPKTEIINLYGQTESTGDCLCAVLTDLGEAAVIDNVVAVGKPITTGFKVSLLNNVKADHDTSTSQSQQDNSQNLFKQLVIKGSHLSNGYLGSSSIFDSFCPGDIGFCHDGIWYVRGRVDEVHKINGILTSASEVESAFCKTYSISDHAGVVAAMVEHKIYLLCSNEDAVKRFSRLYMHKKEELPLNLIPTNVFFVSSIPRSKSGAKKIDRRACLKLIQTQFLQRKTNLLLQKKEEQENKKGAIFSIMAAVLGINQCDLDMNRSFIELGGDSASSITLLYRLKEEIGDIADLTATDILWCKNLDELENLVAGRAERPKRLKREMDRYISASIESTFVPAAAHEVQSWHRSISFLACVDSTPLIIGNSVISACHGGVIMKIGSIGGIVTGYRHYNGWMFQADLLLFERSEKLLVCGYSSSNKGIVICLTSDLVREEWKLELNDAIKSRPIIINDVAWVLSGQTLVGINLRSGNLLKKDLKLPRSCVSNPITIPREDGTVSVLFPSSDWEGGIIAVDTQKMETKIYIDGEIGPVHKGICAIKNFEKVFISDIYGNLHILTNNKMKIMASIQLSSYPLTTATVLDEKRIIVGSNNGLLYCVRYDEDKGHLEKEWECDCYSSVHSKPLKVRDNSIIVATTAGSILKLTNQNGEIQSVYRIPAELWSSPTQIGESNLIVVGGRDSKCHLVCM